MTLPIPTKIGLIAVIVGFALLAESPKVQAATTLTSCQTITVAGSYILGANITGSGTCFSIRAGNVTFDGNGKTVSVSSGDAVEVAHYSGTAPTNVIVKNLISADGVRTYGDAISFVTFENLTVSGITVYGSDDVTIKNNTVGEGGMNISDADNNWPSYRPIVTNNTVTGGSTNVKILVELVGGKYHPCPRLNATFTNNTITDTRNDPPPEATAAVRIRCATHTTFSNNTVRSTGTAIGLYMRDESDDGIYQSNSFQTNSQEVLRIVSRLNFWCNSYNSKL
jgi:nitrous oxidase accessory protein NosD